ncbi:MAG: hypothetical protein R3188_08420 [Acidiferrobacterales bacterium]|nr:hypothetical protein [Acidiferrobacterales bacterium]
MLLKKTAALLFLAILTIGTVACSRVEDPWVPNSSYLKQQRERSPELAMQMRIRVMETQTDR